MIRGLTALVLVASIHQGALAEGEVDPAPSAAVTDVAACSIGEECAVEGALYLSERRGIHAARVDTASGCFAVALSRSQRHALRSRQAARIRGYAYAYYATPNVKYYRIRDRRSGTGKCPSGTMLYATAVERVGAADQ